MTEKRVRNGGDGLSIFQKVWEVLFPFLLYYMAFNAAYLILAFLYQTTVNRIGGAYGQFMKANEVTISGLTGGVCSLIGILPLLPMLKKELQVRAEKKTGKTGTVSVGTRIFILTRIVVFAVSISLGLNALLTLTGFAETSAAYRQVADRQYGVSFGIGLILYGMVSPLAEEALFRGVIYNRLRRFLGAFAGIAVSALFFGLFHGNLVQGVYGTVMGILLACVYERQGSFFAPILFHAAANLAVYTAAYLPGVQAVLFTPAGCAVLLAAAAGCAWAELKKDKFV